jgi:glycosyltransferase involved in cell wall biosynthesis
MSCEVPVVAARAGGIPEVVEDGVTGILCPVGDVDGMAHGALRILRDRELYTAMARAGREAALTRFHPSRIVPQYLEAYERSILG